MRDNKNLVTISFKGKRYTFTLGFKEFVTLNMYHDYMQEIHTADEWTLEMSLHEILLKGFEVVEKQLTDQNNLL